MPSGDPASKSPGAGITTARSSIQTAVARSSSMTSGYCVRTSTSKSVLRRRWSRSRYAAVRRPNRATRCTAPCGRLMAPGSGAMHRLSSSVATCPASSNLGLLMKCMKQRRRTRPRETLSERSPRPWRRRSSSPVRLRVEWLPMCLTSFTGLTPNGWCLRVMNMERPGSGVSRKLTGSWKR